jgi:myo-inositol-1(or 4)-monophosphatase
VAEIVVRDVIAELLRQAGGVLLERLSSERVLERKTSHVDLVSDADRAAEDCILERLSTLAPDDAVISEERGFVNGRSNRTWVVDPLDGTTNYAAGLPDFGVIIGVIDAGQPVAGGMYLPTDDLLYLAESGVGATRNGQRVRVSSTTELEDSVIDHSLAYLRGIVANQRRTLDLLLPTVRAIRCNHSLRYLARVADGIYDAFVYHSLWLWDLVGPSVVLSEAGALVTAMDGRPLDLEPTEASCSRLYAAVAANPVLHAKLMQLFRPA